MSQSEGKIGTSDPIYDLVSILYHALQGADIYAEYVRDAENEGSTELVQFFSDVREEEKRRAERAKELLAKQLSQEREISGRQKAA
jgi:rubrerythrin